MATVYLIHLDRPLAHAKHYIGYTSFEDINQRLQRHKSGDGAKILNACNLKGITYSIVRTWECEDCQSARSLEVHLKRQKHSARYCPVCNQAIVQLEKIK